YSMFVAGFYNIMVANVSSTLITGLNSGTTYQYRVRAVNSAGASANSNVVSVITIPATPVAGASSAISTTSFTAKWNSVLGATNYNLEVSSDGFATYLSYNT